MTAALGPFRFVTDHQRVVSGLLLVLAAVYLVPFVARGWVPLDEGMIGQAAERVLEGELPHVDYEEPYPGALSYWYAAVFSLTGIDLVHLRWTVFGGALAALALVFVILRDFLDPLPAAIATWVALAWSFPNYFSNLPSWWLLLFALACLWGIIRYIDTGRLTFAVIAGLAAGVAFTIKQTGAFLFPPLVMSLMLCGGEARAASGQRQTVEAWLRVATGLAGLALAIVVTRSGLGAGELVYLVAPIGASAITFAFWHRWADTPGRLNWQAPCAALAAASLPVILLLIPHIARGDVWAFVNGVFVLPQKRLQFTTLPMRPPTQLVAAVAALLWVFWAPTSLKPAEVRILNLARWVIGFTLPFVALRVHSIYTFIWEAVRGLAAILPFVVLWLLISKQIEHDRWRRIAFAAAATIAFTSLGQFPFAAPIYFLYVAPLALIAGVAAIKGMAMARRLSDGPAVVVVLLFAFLSMHRGYVWNVGWFHEVHDLSTPLELERAHLNVIDYEAAVYKRVIPLVEQHLGERGLMAGPDTPEIYFLTGQFSPSGKFFEFFSTGDGTVNLYELSAWTAADVIVMFHDKRFSPPLPETLVAKLRLEFPAGESVPPFEVRWR